MTLPVLRRILPKAWRLWPRFAATVPLLGPLLIGNGNQSLARHLLLGDAPDPSVWSAEDLEWFLARLRQPALALQNAVPLVKRKPSTRSAGKEAMP